MDTRRSNNQRFVLIFETLQFLTQNIWLFKISDLPLQTKTKKYHKIWRKRKTYWSLKRV